MVRSGEKGKSGVKMLPTAEIGNRLEQSLTKHASDYLSEEYNAYNA